MLVGTAVEFHGVELGARRLEERRMHGHGACGGNSVLSYYESRVADNVGGYIMRCMKAKRDFSEKDTLVRFRYCNLLKTCSKFHNMTMMKIRT